MNFLFNFLNEFTIWWLNLILETWNAGLESEVSKFSDAILSKGDIVVTKIDESCPYKAQIPYK